MKRIGTSLGLLAVALLGSGCAMMVARIDVYDDALCGFVRKDVAEETLEAAKEQHEQFVYPQADKDLETRRDELFEEAKDDPRKALVGLRESNAGAGDRALTSLDGDPLVAQVVHAERKCWKPAHPSNRARAVARGGNADIAIKMEKDGKFVVKGVRNDAEKVTEAVFKTATKAILLVAQASGVSIDAPDSGGGGADETSADATNAERARLESELRIERQAAADLLEELLAQAASTDDEEQREAAVQRMKTALDASVIGTDRGGDDSG